MIYALLERGLLPDPVIRAGIRRLLRRRLADETCASPEAQQAALMQLIDTLKKSEIAVNTRDANQQHYEVPTAFYKAVLGPHLKYSSGYWQEGDTLASSEERMLRLTCGPAQTQRGERVYQSRWVGLLVALDG